MPKYTDNKVDDRNYLVEARNLTNDLSPGQCHELYEIVISKLQRVPRDSVKEHELLAVKKVLEQRKDLNYDVMYKLRNGYKSSMAHHARAKDGNTEKHKKRV